VFQPALADIDRVRAQCAADLERDPVAARGRLESAAAMLAGTVAHAEQIEAADDRRTRALEQAATVEGEVRRRRAEGWLLAEHGANPDDRIAAARHACDLAAQLLDAGETPAALVHVEQAERLNAEAAALVESIVAARARAEELLPTCAARLEALASRRAGTVRALEHLATTYAESSWADVEDNVGRADEGLARVEQLINEARLALEPSRQEYFRGVALLEEAVRQEDWIEGCHTAVTDRRAELDELRASVPARRDRTGDRVAALERRLHRQQTDRARANERCREASRLLDGAGTALAVARPDLRQAAQLVEAADAAAARAEQSADDDERLARQAADEIEETDALLRRAAAWYAEGVQADVRGAVASLETARSLLGRQRYEDAIKTAGEAAQAGRAAYAAATTEAERRRMRRQQEIRRRQLEESFTRMSRGAGPWVIQLPGGVFSGPDPWRSMQSGPRSATPSSSAGGGWSRDVAQVGW
jgi:ABC-type transporter Mla subunit MlaD